MELCIQRHNKILLFQNSHSKEVASRQVDRGFGLSPKCLAKRKREEGEANNKSVRRTNLFAEGCSTSGAAAGATPPSETDNLLGIFKLIYK